MSKFVDGFGVQLQGKVSDSDLKVVLDELTMYVDKYEAESKTCELAVPAEAIPAEYKEYLVSMKLEGKTLGTIKAYNATLVPMFLTLQMRLQDISTQAIKAYLLHYSAVPHGHCKHVPCAHTMEIMRMEINSFFQWCEDNERIPRNPVRSIKPIKFEKKPIDVLTPIELSKIKFACNNVRERAIVEVLYSSGVRVGELCGIKKSDIQWENSNKHGVVPINVLGKGNKHRKVYINADANIALKAYLDSRKDNCEYLFATRGTNARPMTIRNVQRILGEVGKRANIEHLHPHELRHTRATNFARESGSLLLTSKMLGHANVDTTQRYYIVTDDTELEYEISKYC